MQRLRCFLLQAVGVLTLVILAAGSSALFFAGYWMEVNEAPIKADYILPLAGDKHRLLKAGDLYNEGYAPAILLSNARIHPPSRLKRLQWEIGYPNYTPDEYLKHLLTLLGAESARLEPFGNGHISTVEEAEALREHLAGRTPTLLIVTSPYHARRAQMIFKDILPDCDFRMIVTDEGAFTSRWWTDQASAQNLVMEFAKTLHYLVGGVFRSTDTDN